jgi:hypothetical protein
MKAYEGYGGAIELHEDHVVIRREGVLAKASGKGATREIPRAAITGVTLKPATIAVNGYIQLQLGGDPPRADHPNDPNVVLFRRKRAAEFDELADLLRRRVTENAARGIDPTAVEFDRGATRIDRLQAKQGERNKTFADITLHDDRIESKQGGGGPIAGARAIVDTAGEIDKRITATRLILTGPFAFGLRKKKDNRELYLLVEGRGWAISKELRPNQGAEARAFAARINAAGSAQSATVSPPHTGARASIPATGSPDALGQIKQLGELRDQGLITSDEFDAKKSELLGRL